MLFDSLCKHIVVLLSGIDSMDSEPRLAEGIKHFVVL